MLRNQSGAAAPHSKTQTRTQRGNCGYVLDCGGAPPLSDVQKELRETKGAPANNHRSG
jgi:hypothetical protein